MRTCIAAHSGKVRNTGRISFWAVTWNGLEMDPLCGVLLFRKAKSTDLLNQATFNILTKVSILLGNIFNSGVWPLLLKMYGTLPITKSICFKLLYLGLCLKSSSLVIDEWPVIAQSEDNQFANGLDGSLMVDDGDFVAIAKSRLVTRLPQFGQCWWMNSYGTWLGIMSWLPMVVMARSWIYTTDGW